ncbi:glutathione-S-transferase/glutaredoxin [Angomonas deanei]|nr:glutathione-S-transferase/glutaredoxin [Angomonas deanei]|eukprot:EPY28455.1 glutathione-S-transferase/glutaredoxin [Angomonas deanei]
MRFYRLLGCPYCAKVESVLKYYKLPYEERIINPLNGAGLPDPRYDLAPQIELHSPPEKEPVKSVFLVDSSYIIEKLAQPLGYQKDIEQSKDTTTVISSTRQWITSHFHSASFVLTNSTLRNAYYSYDIVTPTQYQGSLFYKLVGCAALFSIANLKLKGKVQNDGNELMKEYFHAHQKEAYPSDALQWLTEELNVFTNQIKKKNKDGAIFHGGATPDIADIEMFGVTRVIDRHPVLGKAARQGDFGAWQEAMQKFYD